MSFTGEYRHTIDTKGRLIVPSRLRDELVEGRVVLTTWPDGCIALWSGAGWQEFEAKLLTQRAGSQNNRKVVRTFAASAFTDEVDRQGRISVPSHLREQAGIDKDVVVVGALDHAELWAPDRLDLGRGDGRAERVGRRNELLATSGRLDDREAAPTTDRRRCEVAKVMNANIGTSPERSGGLAREVSQGIVVLALVGASVGGLLGMVAIATRALSG